MGNPGRNSCTPCIKESGFCKIQEAGNCDPSASCDYCDCFNCQDDCEGCVAIADEENDGLL